MINDNERYGLQFFRQLIECYFDFNLKMESCLQLVFNGVNFERKKQFAIC